MENVTFHDYKPEALSLYDAVVDGLSWDGKSIPPKFFYDERGSELFDRICEQPEYYLPRAERDMLTELAPEIADLTGTGRLLIEPGAGSTTKVRGPDLGESTLTPVSAPSAYSCAEKPFLSH